MNHSALRYFKFSETTKNEILKCAKRCFMVDCNTFYFFEEHDRRVELFKEVKRIFRNRLKPAYLF